MDFKYKTYKIEQYVDGSWVGAALTNPHGSFTDEYTGLTEDQTQCVIDTFVMVGVSSEHLRVVRE
tara:strand:+ start:1372 stop:1566 length:195 start_codon:yes stop_codon:yes gene_type:complete